MNRFPRPITREEFERLTAQTPDNSAALSQARAQAARDRYDRLQQFKANVSAALASPEVDTFKKFLATLDRDERLGVLEALRDDDN